MSSTCMCYNANARLYTRIKKLSDLLYCICATYIYTCCMSACYLQVSDVSLFNSSWHQDKLIHACVRVQSMFLSTSYLLGLGLWGRWMTIRTGVIIHVCRNVDIGEAISS
jgi:hypothetical protein